MIAGGGIFLLVRRPAPAPAPLRRIKSAGRVSGGLLSRGRRAAHRRLRRARARARVRHAGLRRRRGRPARSRPRVHAALAGAPDGEVVFASKAFPCTAVLRVFHEEGLASTSRPAASSRWRCSAGFDPARIVLHGNAKSEAELRDGDRGRRRHDRRRQLRRARQAGARSAAAARQVLLRVTPGVVADTHAAILTGHAGSKFGFGLADAPRRSSALRATDGLDLRGLHMHIGSQLLRPRAVAARGRGDRRRSATSATYDLGGGLAVAYTTATSRRRVAGVRRARWSPPPTSCSGAGKRALDRARPRAGRERRRDALHRRVGQATSATRASRVDGGMSDNLRPMLYDAPLRGRPRRPRGRGGTPCTRRRQALRVRRRAGPRRRRCPTRGPATCSSTPVTGAYGYAMANNYNGVPRPPVVFCTDGDARVVVRRETYEDLYARDV